MRISLNTLWRTSADDKLIIHSPQKHDLTLHANCLLFSGGKQRKGISKCRLLIFNTEC